MRERQNIAWKNCLCCGNESEVWDALLTSYSHTHNTFETKQNEKSAEQIQIYGVRVWIIYKMKISLIFEWKIVW